MLTLIFKVSGGFFFVCSRGNKCADCCAFTEHDVSISIQEVVSILL